MCTSVAAKFYFNNACSGERVKGVVIGMGDNILQQFCQCVVVHFISPSETERSDVFII